MNASNVSPEGSERTVEIARPDPRDDLGTAGDEPRVRRDRIRDLARRLRLAPDRRQKLDAVRARLTAGELDRPDAFRAAANAMLRGLL